MAKLLKTSYHLVVNNFLAIVAVAFATAVFRRGWPVSIDDLAGWLHAQRPVHLLTAVILMAAVAKLRRARRPRDVYLVEYGCFRPKPCFRAPFATCREHVHLLPYLLVDKESLSFAIRLLERSGLGEETCVPHSYHYMPPDSSLQAAREEAELVIFSAIDEVFAKATVKPADIDVLIVNCSIFTPTPVFVDMVANRYKLRSDVQSLNLSGMGCGAGLVSVGLAKNLLQVAPPGSHVLTVSTEILSSQYYVGSERAMLLPNCLFRMGAAATILSNTPQHARFKLGRVVRTMTAARDADYRCIFQEEDDKGILGVRLSKDLTTTAGNALKRNIVAFGPLVLPASEQILVALSLLKRKLLSWRGKVRLYRPDFRTAFQHFCIHAGGRAVIDEVQRGLGLSDEDVEASRMTLHRFGNTSSSLVLYELAYTEAKGRMRKGDRVWMISFGSGFECSCVALECVKPAADADGPWADCVHRYPVQLPDVGKDM
ncbi:3-ketoacyl-CoA synthase 6 [Dichanthelium oligosanthes]|uniref:3-ketoacyl-CoA synthase n=1 Tax=Dichanthelium oligosanthes TaxID=888268 RepID=A0A1E5V9H5_9POAL|nr:3-ketoacyl-CoA synthase 6 [Dichanthelium oligosanthes]